jgi:hypothetical protein
VLLPLPVRCRFTIGPRYLASGRRGDASGAAAFPRATVRTQVVCTPRGFEATRLSGPNAARRAYWLRLDRLVAAARD